MFKGKILQHKKPLYLGLYVNDFVYFSEDPAVEHAFQQKFSSLSNVNFMGKGTHFLGIKFEWKSTPDNVLAHLSQPAFTENLIKFAGLDHDSALTKPSPYRSGLPIDAILP